MWLRVGLIALCSAGARTAAASAPFTSTTPRSSFDPARTDGETELLFRHFVHQRGRGYASAAEEARARTLFDANLARGADYAAANPRAAYTRGVFADAVPVGAEFNTKWMRPAATVVRTRRQGGGENFSTTSQLGSSHLAHAWDAHGFAPVAAEDWARFAAAADASSAPAVPSVMWISTGHNTTGVVPDGAPMPRAVPPTTPVAYLDTAVAGFEKQGGTVARALQRWLAVRGPLAVEVDASQLPLYSGGVVDECRAGGLTRAARHLVIVAGYRATAEGVEFTLQNSWGARWGEAGGTVRVSGAGVATCLWTPTDTVREPLLQLQREAALAPSCPPHGAAITQYNCNDFLCIISCQEHSYGMNQCLKSDTIGGSIMALACDTRGVSMRYWLHVEDCSGYSTGGVQPINRCVYANAVYWYNICGKPPQSTTPIPVLPAPKPAPAGTRAMLLLH